MKNITTFVFNNVQITMTWEQLNALLQKLPEKGWTPDYATVHRMPADTCIGVVCKTKSGNMSMFFGIEEDGYCHT